MKPAILIYVYSPMYKVYQEHVSTYVNVRYICWGRLHLIAQMFITDDNFDSLYACIATPTHYNTTRSGGKFQKNLKPRIELKSIINLENVVFFMVNIGLDLCYNFSRIWILVLHLLRCNRNGLDILFNILALFSLYLTKFTISQSL